MKKMKVEYEENITKINSIIIEVDDNFDENEIWNALYSEFRDCSHPDDVKNGVSKYGRIVETCEGAENSSFEIL